jgi:uncharacterized protein (TIGR03435 family)
MLRGLLLDQFDLKTHIQNRETTVYALMMVAGNKPKFTQAEDSERAGCKPDPNAPSRSQHPHDDRLQEYLDGGFGEGSPARGECTYRSPNRRCYWLIRRMGLSDWLDAQGPVTGAAAREPQSQRAGREHQCAGGAVLGATDPNGISVFDAVEKELGLKLVKQKRSIPVIVVDHVDEKPVE